MSRHYIEKISCPNCNSESEMMIWQSVNTMLDPEMKEKVRNGEAFMFTCPICGDKFPVMYPMLYHQMEDEVMIYLVHPDEVEKTVEMFTEPISKHMDDITKYMDDMRNSYMYRVVSSYNELKEKLLILDDYLDDRAIEIMKLFIRVKLSENEGVEIEECYYDVCETGACFAVNTPEGWGTVAFDKEFYNSIKELYFNLYCQEDAYLVDFAWAANVIRKDNEE